MKRNEIDFILTFIGILLKTYLLQFPVVFNVFKKEITLEYFGIKICFEINIF